MGTLRSVKSKVKYCKFLSYLFDCSYRVPLGRKQCIYVCMFVRNGEKLPKPNAHT